MACGPLVLTTWVFSEHAVPPPCMRRLQAIFWKELQERQGRECMCWVGREGRKGDEGKVNGDKKEICVLLSIIF